MWDVCIVGAGISGLYMAWKLLQQTPPSIRILLVEKSSHFGGKCRMVPFHRHWIVTGAGIGRWKKDVYLKRLVRQALSYTKEDHKTDKSDKTKKTKKTKKTNHLHPFLSRICYAFPGDPAPIQTYLNILQQHRSWLLSQRSSLTFKQAFLHFFSKEEWERFCATNGYTDFEQADIIDTLDHYGWDDNQPGASLFSVPWNQVLEFLRKQLTPFLQSKRFMIKYQHQVLETNILSPCEVQLKIRTKKSNIEWITSRYVSRYVIFAGHLDGMKGLKSSPILHQQIGTQPFLRRYVWWKHDSLFEKGTRYVGKPFQKQIALSPRLHMVSYSDQSSATRVSKMSRQELQRYLLGEHHSSKHYHHFHHYHHYHHYQQQQPQQILDDRMFYFPQGTGFFHPLSKSFSSRQAFIDFAQHPHKEIFVVGEMVSQEQGWTEGALQSIHRILPKLVTSLRN